MIRTPGLFLTSMGLAAACVAGTESLGATSSLDGANGTMIAQLPMAPPPPPATGRPAAALPSPGHPMSPPASPMLPPRSPAPMLRSPVAGKWWKNSEIARELNLTDAQVSQIEQTFLEHRLALIDLRADLEKQETLLQPLIDVDRPDEAKVAAQIERVLATRGRLEKTNTMMLLAVRRALSVEQWRRLQAFQERALPPPPNRPTPRRLPVPTLRSGE